MFTTFLSRLLPKSVQIIIFAMNLKPYGETLQSGPFIVQPADKSLAVPTGASFLRSTSSMVNLIVQTGNDRDPNAWKDLIPLKGERKARFGHLPVECSSASCGKFMPRANSKTCSKCKQVRIKCAHCLLKFFLIISIKARYCDKICQKEHWYLAFK